MNERLQAWQEGREAGAKGQPPDEARIDSAEYQDGYLAGQFESGLVPGYWMHETSGVLRPAVEAYLTRAEQLSPEHLAAWRAYLRQWMATPAWNGPAADRLRGMIDGITSRARLSSWLDLAEEQGIDPL